MQTHSQQRSITPRPSTLPPASGEREAQAEFERRIKEVGEEQARLERLHRIAGGGR